MNVEEFQQLVDRLTLEERADPRGFRRRALRMVALGYAYLVAVLVCVSIVMAFAVGLIFVVPPAGFLLAIVCLVTAAILLRALWVSFELPQGRKLTEAEAPALFRLAEEARAGAMAPKWQLMLLTTDVNASMIQQPRLGMFGWHRNVLVIGMPLLLGSTRDEMASILAHEMGHLSHEHGRLGAWIWRQHSAWDRVGAVVAAAPRSLPSLLLGRFVRWFVPRFNGIAFVLRRAQEREADALAVRIAGARAAADALTRVSLLDRVLDSVVWTPLRRVVEEAAAPPAEGPFARQWRLTGEPPPPEIHSWLQQSLALVTTAVDTHPCLRERLAAMGMEPRIPPEITGITGITEASRTTTSAAQELLGSSLPGLIEELDGNWRREIAGIWEQLHRADGEGRREMATLTAAASERKLTPVEHARLAELAESLDGDAAALERWRQRLEHDPSDAVSSMHVGRLLLAQGEPSGIEFIEAGMRHGRAERVAGAQMLFEWHDRRGEREKALVHARTLEAHEEEWAKAVEERNDLGSLGSKALEVQPHRLSAEEEREALGHLASVPRLRRAWLVRRRVVHAPDVPAFLLVVELATRWWKPESEVAYQALAGACSETPLPGTLHVVWKGHRAHASLRRLCQRLGPPAFERA